MEDFTHHERNVIQRILERKHVTRSIRVTVSLNPKKVDYSTFFGLFTFMN